MRNRSLTLSLCLIVTSLSQSAFAVGMADGSMPVPPSPSMPSLPPTGALPPMPSLPPTEGTPPTPSLPPAAATLPAVEVQPTTPVAGLPTVPAAPNAPIVNDLDTPLAGRPAANSVSSIGSSNLSLFFTPNQIRALREALTSFESRQGSGDLEDISLEVAPEEKKIVVEPPNYPVFYLSSIVFHTPNDWSIWVSGHKITSHKNTTTLRIISVTDERVGFLWAPTYGDAIATRKQNNLFASADPVKNKLTHPSTVSYDPKTGFITFSLLINQSFAAGYFNTFEGLIASPTLPPLPTPAKAGEGSALPIPAVNEMPPRPAPGANPEAMDIPQPNQGLADDSINALVKRVKR